MFLNARADWPFQPVELNSQKLVQLDRKTGCHPIMEPRKVKKGGGGVEIVIILHKTGNRKSEISYCS